MRHRPKRMCSGCSIAAGNSGAAAGREYSMTAADSGIRQDKENRKVLVTASVASMLDLFNRDNIRILKESGWQVEVAANFSSGNITSPARVRQFYRELRQMGIAVHPIPVPRKAGDLIHILRSYRMLKKLCETQDYSLIHTQSPIGGAVLRLAAAPCRKKGCRVIYTAHGFHFYKGASLLRWLCFYPVEKWLSAYTDVLITINAEDYRLARRFSAREVCLVPGIGIHLSDYCPDAGKRRSMRRAFGFRRQDFVVLGVGQLSRRKNQEVVIQALALLGRDNVHYVLAGIGERKAYYCRLARKLGVERNVHFTGYRSDIPDLLRMADCFAFPSRQEGLPVALMEAMAAKVPVVCSRIRGNCDLVRDGIEGRLVAPKDAAGFADAIRQMMDQPEFADACRDHARKRVGRCSSDLVNRKMERIYASAHGMKKYPEGSL